jgi:hypothetical protein
MLCEFISGKVARAHLSQQDSGGGAFAMGQALGRDDRCASWSAAGLQLETHPGHDPRAIGAIAYGTDDGIYDLHLAGAFYGIRRWTKIVEEARGVLEEE